MRMKALGSIVVVVVLALAGCSSSGTVGNGGSVSADAASKADFCTLIIAFRKANETLGNDLAATDAEQSKAAMKLLIGQLKTLVERAPADIKSDLETANKFMVQFDALMAAHDYDTSGISEDPTLQADLKNLNSADVTGALDRIAAYTTTDCVLPPTPTS
ncbi:MAG: hypothetical protein F2735_07635 [Actinobacteria bacterium]|uniref:Unannotated protein n=1 Tax=freshwater metagenome TaxID=449393 RepID=A0A6J6YPX1_9ZZZZ|nr:hypothetical protein [Actinomycetota bacterium]